MTVTAFPLASIPSPSFNQIEIGPLDVHIYGILIAIGVAVAFTLTRNRWEARGGDPDFADRVMLRAVVFGFIGARLAYVSTHLGRFDGDPLDPWQVIAVWEGGLALFGGLTLGIITAYIMLKRADASVLHAMDAAAVGIPLAQAIGRWGNYFNQELFGTPTDLPWGLEIDPANRPAAYPDAETFHPTFLYESLYNLAVVGVLLLLERRRSLKPGSLMGTYLALYGLGRFLLELIRTDTTFRLLGLSRNAWVALLVSAAAGIWLYRRERSDAPAGTTDPEGAHVEADEPDPIGSDSPSER